MHLIHVRRALLTAWFGPPKCQSAKSQLVRCGYRGMAPKRQSSKCGSCSGCMSKRKCTNPKMKQLVAPVPLTCAPLTLRSKTPDLAPFVGHDRSQRTVSDDCGMEALLSALDSAGNRYILGCRHARVTPPTAGAAGSLSRSSSASSIAQKAPSTPVISLRLLVPSSPHSP